MFESMHILVHFHFSVLNLAVVKRPTDGKIVIFDTSAKK